MICPSCQSDGDEAAETCFSCGFVFVSVVRRGGVLASRYEILRPLGRGGMGAVYEAHDRVLDETVALKVLRPDIARSEELTLRFRSEIKLARRVRHPNVCAIHEYGEDGALRFISMELVDGVDLKRVLRGRGALPPAEAIDVGIQAARGLAAIHAAGIVHRDLKTPNLMRDAQGVVRLMDFGIAKLSGAEPSSSTGAGMVMGTPEYMSPEQASAHRVDGRSDVYSLGVVLYELFTGELPFHGDTPVATLLKHLQQAPPLDAPAAAAIPGPVKDVLRRMLSKSVDERQASATELVAELARARDDSGLRAPFSVLGLGLASLEPASESGATITLSTPVPSPVRGRKRRTNRFLLVALAATIVLAAGVGLGRQTAQPEVSAGEPGRQPVVSPTPEASPIATAPAPEASPTPEPAPATPEPTPRAPTRTQVARASVPKPTVVPLPNPSPGTLQVFVLPWAEVSVDGNSVGQAWPSKDLVLLPGTHVVRLVHPDFKPVERRVTVHAGEKTSLRLDLDRDAGLNQENP